MILLLSLSLYYLVFLSEYEALCSCSFHGIEAENTETMWRRGEHETVDHTWRKRGKTRRKQEKKSKREIKRKQEIQTSLCADTLYIERFISSNF